MATKDKTPLSPEQESITRGKRKDTKRWCRGKVGVEHQRALRISPQLLALAERASAPKMLCEPLRGYTLSGEPVYRTYCDHEEYCTACGKVLRWGIPREECPDREAGE